jgi:hypothetical protein
LLFFFKGVYMKKFFMIATLVVAAFSTGCTRITDGEIGVRVTTGGTIEGNELNTGYHQVLFGDVLQFPIRDLTVPLNDAKPLTADNSALADFDVSIVYSVSPAAVAELYKNKAKSFHMKGTDGDVYLMYNYMNTLVNNAVYKSVRGYKSLEVADSRVKIEAEIRDLVQAQLREENLDTSLILSAVQVRNIQPNADILKAATDLVKSQNELKIKQNEIAIAEAEAKRQKALSENAGQSIAYMQAQSQLLIAEAVKAGKVQTIIIPSNLTALGNINK